MEDGGGSPGGARDGELLDDEEGEIDRNEEEGEEGAGGADRVEGMEMETGWVGVEVESREFVDEVGRNSVGVIILGVGVGVESPVAE